jgi:hypothetical protein
MHYGFAPNGTAQDARLRHLFGRRANTRLVHSARLGATRDFIGHLRTSAAVTRPIEDVLLGSHASGEGSVELPMFAGQAGPTTFETLEDTIANAAHSVAIPDALINHNAGDPITHNVHFKGCNIGRAPPFLTKLREALGDHVNVTAPRHFHGLYEHPRYGTWEYMAYEFIIRQSSDFPNTAAAVAAFQTGGFRLLDGSAVPTTAWPGWIPSNIAATRTVAMSLPLGVSIGRRTTVDTERQFRVERRYPFTWRITYPNVASVPAPAGRQAAFEASMLADPHFDSAHPFPMYERVGYANVTDFLAGYTWHHLQSGTRLVTTGTRTVYTVVIPITDPATGNIIFNFHPLPSTLHTECIGFAESDPLYFGSA